MSRLMDGGDEPAYRGVITTTRTRNDGSRAPYNTVKYAGPYATHGAAKAAITRAQREARDRTPWHAYTEIVTGYVEVSATAWTRHTPGS